MTKVIVAPFAPPAVQIVGLLVLKVTTGPDDAVADTVIGDCANVAAGRPPNVMLCDSLLPLLQVAVKTMGAPLLVSV